MAVKLITRMATLLAVLATLLLQTVISAEPSQASDAQTARISFESNRGTWMSVSAAPNGKWIAFDHLGHIYRMPISGGLARCLTCDPTHPFAVNARPQISPDGQHIAFSSDRAGVPNLWVMSADGTVARLVAAHEEGRLGHVAWSDKQTVYATHAYSGLWRYDVDTGAKEHVSGDWQSMFGGPSMAADGARLYLHGYRGPDSDLYPVEPTRGDYGIFSIDLAANEFEPRWLSPEGNHELAPQVSPDGRFLAFVRRNLASTISVGELPFGPAGDLVVKDLRTGEEGVLLKGVTPDLAEGFVNYQNVAALPSFAWTHDSTAVIIAHRGQLLRIDRESGTQANVLFTVEVDRLVRQRARPDDFGLAFRGWTRWASSHPEHQAMAFTSHGGLGIVERRSGSAPEWITLAREANLFWPRWSPDGEQLAAVEWSAQDGAKIRLMDRHGALIARAGQAGAEYFDPAFSPDGSTLYAVRATGEGTRLGTHMPERQYELVRFDLHSAGLDEEPLRTLHSFERSVIGPAPLADGSLIVAESGFADRDASLTLYRIDPETLSATFFARLPYVDALEISSDGESIAVEWRNGIYLAPLKSSQSRNLALEDLDAAGFNRVSRDFASDPVWVGDQLQFLEGGALRTVGSDTAVHRVGVPMLPVAPTKEVKPVLLRGARLVDVRNRTVRLADLAIGADGRILCVGRCESGGARVIDLAGRFIMPGLINAHGGNTSFISGELVSQAGWDQRAALALGITHSHHPVHWHKPLEMLAQSSADRAEPVPAISGRWDRIRPRQGSEDEDVAYHPVANEGQASDLARMSRRSGAIGLIVQAHEHDMPRQQAQWLSDAAKAQGLGITAHGVFGSYDQHLAAIFDGFTSLEHTPAFLPVESDFLTLIERTGFTYVFTVGLASGRQDLESHFVRRGDLQHPAILSHWPASDLERFHADNPRARQAHELPFALTSALACQLDNRGIAPALGSEGFAPGIALHWEMEMMAANCDPWVALRAATIGNAQLLGLDRDIGLLEVGMRADLVVLAGNPTEDIRRTRDIIGVFKAGYWHPTPR